MRFLFETYKKYHEKGLNCHKNGHFSEARTNYLLAAKYLCSMAQESDDDLKQARLQKAQRLIEVAKGLEGKSPATAGKGAAVSVEEKESPESGEKWVVTNPPAVNFADVVGLEDVKRIIELRVIYPFRHPEVTERFGKKAGGGVLLYGPPGTGKTLIARAIANELELRLSASSAATL